MALLASEHWSKALHRPSHPARSPPRSTASKARSAASTAIASSLASLFADQSSQWPMAAASWPLFASSVQALLLDCFFLAARGQAYKVGLASRAPTSPPPSCLADLFDLDTPRLPSSQRIRPLLNRQCSRRKARQDARLFPYRLAHLQDRRDPLRRCKCSQPPHSVFHHSTAYRQADSMHYRSLQALSARTCAPSAAITTAISPRAVGSTPRSLPVFPSC